MGGGGEEVGFSRGGEKMMHEYENATIKPLILYNQCTLIKWIEFGDVAP